MTATRIDPELIHPDASTGRAKVVPDAVDALIAAVNSHADDIDGAAGHNVKDYGAAGDGAKDDTAAIQAAANAAAATLSSGQYGAMVHVPKGKYVISSAISLPDGVGIVGDNPAACKIVASSTFNDTALVKNALQSGQEYCFIQGVSLDGNRGGGAVQSVAVVDLTSCFINSFVRDCIISGGSSTGLHIGAKVSAGPVLIDNTWVIDHGGDCVLIDEDASNTQSMQGIVSYNLTAERPGNGCAAVHLKSANGHCSGWSFHNTHIEILNNGAGTAGFLIDNVYAVLIDGAQIQAISGAGSIVGIQIKNAANVSGIQIRNVTNINSINPILKDESKSVQFGAVNLPFYATSDVGIFPTAEQTLTYGTSVATDMTKGNFCILVVTDGVGFTIANPTNVVPGHIVTYEIVNGSSGAMGAITWGSDFQFRDGSFSAPASGKRRTITFRRRSGNNWIQVGAATGDM